MASLTAGAVVATGGVVQSATTVAAATTTVTVAAAADSYIDSGHKTSNYGTRTTLNVDASPARATLVRFNIPALTQPVSKATLKLYVANSSPDGLVVATNGDGWTETAVTWSNAPAAGTKLTTVTGLADRTWAAATVTAAVVSGKSVSFRVTTPGATQLALDSRECGATLAPVLEIQTAATTPSPTPTSASPTPTSASPTPTSASPTPTSASPTPTSASPTPTSASPTPTSASPTPTSPSPTPTSASPTPTPTDVQPAFPIQAAFYYPWFPEAWTQKSIYPFTYYQPSRGYYDGRSSSVIASQVDDMLYAGIDAGIASWWGQGSKEDTRIPLLLSAASGTAFRWSLYYENESLGDPTTAQISADLAYIKAKYGTDPSYLRVNGKPVIFVYADAVDGCGMADRWVNGNTSGFYVVLKVFPGYANCAQQPAGWHQYAPANASDSQGVYSYAVSPGFWLRTDAAARLVRDATRFETNVAAMSKSTARFQLVTTYNEWGEGTPVESATQWASASGRGTYLDILHKYFNP